MEWEEIQIFNDQAMRIVEDMFEFLWGYKVARVRQVFMSLESDGRRSYLVMCITHPS
jgi:hypothetical protein